MFFWERRGYERGEIFMLMTVRPRNQLGVPKHEVVFHFVWGD